MHFTTNFEISLENFLNVLGFLLLTSEKNGGDTFLHRYFFSAFSMIMVHVSALGIFFMICSSVCGF